jgi:hypothetical protein
VARPQSEGDKARMTTTYQQSLEQAEQLYQQLNVPCGWAANQLWVFYNHMVVPVGSPTERHELTPAQAADLLQRLGGWLVRWTEQIDGAPASPWYSVICDAFLPLDQNPSRGARSKIRRGLKRCDVCPISAQTIRDQGYVPYCEALGRYRRPPLKPMTESAFVSSADVEAAFDRVVEYWGIFLDSRLIGYSRNTLFGTECVNYELIRLNEQCLKHYGAYALVQAMNEHYLLERGFRLTNDGSRSVLHETAFQELLVDNLGFRRGPQHLYVQYRPMLNLAVRGAYPFRCLIGHVSDEANALLTQEAIHRQCRNQYASDA